MTEFINADVNNKESIYKLVSEVQSSSEPVLVKIRENERLMAVGVAIPSNKPGPISYLKDCKEYNDTTKDIYDQIDLCRKLYIWEGVVGTVIDLFVDTVFSKFKIEGLKKSDKAYKLLEYFCNNVNKGNNNVVTGIDALNKNIALEYYICGNVFLYSKWGQILVDTLKSKYRLPISQVILDPKIIEMPEEMVQFGNKLVKISYNRLFGKKLNLTRKDREKILESIPTKVRNKLGSNQDIILDPYFTYHVKRKGSMYSAWGIPYLTRSFLAVSSKRKLRALDDSTIDGMINSVTIYKIGDPKIPETWSPSRLNAFASLLQKPSPTMTLVWSFDVEHIHISPSGDVLKYGERYKDANTDILYALGVPLALLTGEGDRAGDVWAAIMFLVERLEEYRSEFKACTEDTLNKILEENDFTDKKVKIRFIKPRINKDDVRNIVLALYDRGLLSKETTLEEANYMLDSEAERRKTEKEEELDDIMMRPATPFSANPSKNPNPQTNSPNLDDKTNVKKQTKDTEVNKKEVKVTPRLEGNTSDKMIEVYNYLMNSVDFPLEKEYFDNALSNVFDNIEDADIVFGSSFDEILKLNEYIFNEQGVQITKNYIETKIKNYYNEV